MGPSCDLAEISALYYHFPVRSHFSGKFKVSNFEVKLYPYQGLNKTSLPTKFQNFWANHLRDMSMLAQRRFFYRYCVMHGYFEKNHISEMVCPKILKLCK